MVILQENTLVVEEIIVILEEGDIMNHLSKCPLKINFWTDFLVAVFSSKKKVMLYFRRGGWIKAL
jgi:hypothetical protein